MTGHLRKTQIISKPGLCQDLQVLAKLRQYFDTSSTEVMKKSI